MKKTSLTIVLVSCLFMNNVYGLSKRSHDKVNFCVSMFGFNGCEMVEEKQVYKFIYDQKYDYYFSSTLEQFDQVGFDSHYFVDDMKKYADCYAEAFAEEVTMKDIDMIYNESTPKAAREAIINNIAYKRVDKCKKKYAPYMDKFEDVATAYLEKVCGSSKPSKSVEKKCKKKYDTQEDINKCVYEEDEFLKCFMTVTSDLKKIVDKAE